MLKVFDLFCGTGGFSYGFDQSHLGFQTIFGIDAQEISLKTFQLNHTKAWGLQADIRRIRRFEIAEKLNLKKGEVDLIIGGPPCQGFSSIRPFRSSNEDDPRNSLFEEYASFVNFFRPKMFVLENVVGLATHKNGQTLDAIEQCFQQLNYHTEWRIMNAAHYGVPQKRERLILIGAEAGMPIIFPQPTHHGKSPTIGYKHKEKMIESRQMNLFETDQLFPYVSVMDAISDLPDIEAGEEIKEYTQTPKNRYQALLRNQSETLTLHSATAHSKKMLEIISYSGKNIDCIPKHLITSGFSSCYSRLDADAPAVTLTVNFVHPSSNRCIHPTQNRALTPREGARLQSFPDAYQFFGNRTKIIKQIGNAVPPMLGQAIATSVAQAFNL